MLCCVNAGGGESVEEIKPVSATDDDPLFTKTPEELRELIRGIYQRKAPDKLAALPQAFEHNKGRELEMYKLVLDKYGETTTRELVAEAPVDVPEGAVLMQFITLDDEIKKIVFEKQPFGMTFDNRCPIVITKLSPGGVAESVGVSVAWQLVKIDNQSLEGKSFTQCLHLIKAAASKLPVVE
mmetsp:Transcript_112165/g.216091  ORF Transcript_112165/g.216091 Transcript_112165/m.216091 type:complete len:182 (+) Transcript_112165:72-617(+)